MDTTSSNDRRLRPVFANILNLLVILTIAIAAAGIAHAEESGPFIWADPFHDVVNGWGWNDGDTLTLRVFDENGTEERLQKPTRTYTAENGAAFELRSEELPLHPGYRLTLGNGTITKELSISPLEITDISPSTGTISGIYDPSLGFRINVQGQQPASLAFDANHWTASFAELPAGAGGEAAQPDGDGDMTGIGFFVPNPFLVAFPGNDAVEAWEWPNGASVHLSIDDPSTPNPSDFDADGTMAVTNWGDPRTYFRFEFNGQYDLKPGDTVSIGDGWTTRTHTVRNLSVILADAAADTVAGTADAGAEIQVWPHGFDQQATVQVTAGRDGNWLAGFSGLFDLGIGTGGRSQIRDDVGNATAVDWEARLNYDIYAYNPLTGSIQKITNLPRTDEYNPSWSPNGKLIAHDVVNRDGSQGIYITDVKTGVTTPLLGAEDGGNDAMWSPNGKWVAFDRRWVGDADLYLVPSTGGTRALVRENAISADWAPNGKRLVFQQPSDGSIRTVAVDGGDGDETTIATSGANPSWSPDANWIAYENEGHIWKVQVNVQGRTFGDPIQVTSSPFSDGQPTWSPDSTAIVYHSAFTGDWDLWTVPASGGMATWLNGAPEFGDYDPAYAKNNSNIAYASFSPEGQAARTWAAAYAYDVGTWSEGQHSYHFDATWNGGGETSNDVSFNVSNEAQPYDGHVLLRPGAVRGGMDCPAIEAIRPDQPTRFLAGWTTIHEMAYYEAAAFLESLSARAVWDDGQSAGLTRHEIIPFSLDNWFQYVCTFTSP